MTSRNNESVLSRKQRLRDKQRRQLKVLDAVEKHEKKLATIQEEKERKIAAIEKDAADEAATVEREMAKTIVEAVDVFGSQQSAADELGLSLREIRRFLNQEDEDEAAEAAEASDGADGAKGAADVQAGAAEGTVTEDPAAGGAAAVTSSAAASDVVPAAEVPAA